MFFYLPHRIGTGFFHRDSRLETGHPIIVRSVDASGLFTSCTSGNVRFDYGYGGSKDGIRLCVEIAIRNPHPGILWMYEWFDVRSLIDEDQTPPALRNLARILKVDSEYFKAEILQRAPWKKVEDIDTLEDYAREFGEDALLGLLATMLTPRPRRQRRT